MSFRNRIAAVAFCTVSPLALAFPIFSSPPADTVVEYFNTGTGHYFYTWSQSDQAALDSGAFGAGWVRTGQGFGAYGTLDRARGGGYAFDACASAGACLPITRFYAPGPNSHFFTGLASDVAILDRPGTGWFRESVAFYTGMPDASGNCPGTPVHRLYNNRAAFNDSNHRYTADETARQLMVARGWVDEGVAFCAYGKRTTTAETHSFSVPGIADIMDIRDCRAATVAGSCLGVMNLPIPSHAFTSTSIGFERDDFDRQTGMDTATRPLTMAVTGGPRNAAAADAFIQLSNTINPAWNGRPTGIHLATQSRIGEPYASITALRRLQRATVFPYRFDTGTDRELHLQAWVFVQEVAAREGSHAYGVFTLQFTDEVSGRSLLFNIIAFGTLPAGEGVGRDLHTSLPLVYATAGTDGRFGKIWGGPPRAIAQQVNPLNGFYQAWINRRHFQGILEAARQVDPLLSPRPEDYSVANFGLVNEAYGEGEIGLVMTSLSLMVKGAD